MSSVLQFIRNILTGSIHEGIESEAVRKTLIFNLVSVFGVFLLLFFGIKNISTENYLLEYVVLISVLFSTSLFFYLRITKNLNRVSHILIIGLLLLNIFFLISPLGEMSAIAERGENSSIFVWLYVFPLLSLFLLGLKRGLFYTFALLSICISLFLTPNDFLPKYTGSDQFWFVGTYILITIISTIIEYARAKTYNELIEQRTHIEKLVRERTAELELAKENAEEANNLKSAFLNNLSHEIRTPLNAIVGFSNLLLSENIDANLKKDMVNHIVSNSNTLLNLVDDIIDISKIESGQLEMHYHEVNLQNTVAHIYNEFLENKSNSEKHINLIFDLKESPEITIISDANRISQILRLLLENAFKFTERGEIHLGYTIENQNLVRFYVKDTGIGIPKNLGNKIFQRFVTGDSIKHKFYRGSGLGLNISKSLVELLGGTIEFDSKINKGSTFYFTIANKPEDISKTALTIPPDLNWDNKTILIAEDEECNYKYLKHLLNRTNATILWANNGQEAVDMASKHDIDLILMDIKMPVMNGLEATRVIKGLNKNIPIIAQTAFIYENDEKVSLRSGCDAYIAKPIGKNQLIELMQRFIK